MEGPFGPERRLGVVRPERGVVVDLRLALAGWLEHEGATPERAASLAASAFPADMRQFIEGGAWAKDLASKAVDHAVDTEGTGATTPAAGVHWTRPLVPPVLRDFLAFEDHMVGSYQRLSRPIPDAWYEMPVYYKGNPTTVIGPEEEVPWPPYTSHLDYELELGLIIGRPGTNVPVGEAEGHLFGLTCFNDFSARDIQSREMSVGLGPAKGKDFATAIGPWIVTIDEFPDLYNLKMLARLNGEPVCEGTTGRIFWRFGQLIHHASLGEQLNPGDLLGSGTIGGGSGLEIGRRLRPGDVVEIEISGIGVLRNRVGSPEGGARGE